MKRYTLIFGGALCVVALPIISAAPAAAQDGPWRLLGGATGENPYEEPLVTDRPDFTEASSTVGRGVAQLETGYTYVYRDDEATGEISQNHTAPEMLWRIGLADPVELRIGWTYEWGEANTGVGTVSSDGSNDLYLGAKLELLEQQRWIPEQAVILQTTAPTGGEDFTTDNSEWGVNYLYSWDLTNEWGLAGSTGFDTDREEGDEFLLWHQSVSLGIPLSEPLAMYVEYFGLYSHARGDETQEHYLDAGFTYLVSDNVQLDIRWGKGLSDDADDFFTGAGGSFRF